MPDRDATFRYIGITAIALLLFGLGGWYLFISRQTTGIQDTGAARGFDIGIPSFSGSRGSTSENIALGFAAASQADAAKAGNAKRPPRLWKVSTTPVAGAGFISTGSSTILRFIERSTGNVFDADPETSALVRRTKTLMPRTYEALVGGGESVILRSLDENDAVVTFAGRIGTTTTEDGSAPLVGKSLGTDLRDVEVSRVPDIVFLASVAGDAHLLRASLDGSTPKQLAAFSVDNFNVRLLSDDRITLAERAASAVPGNAYELGKDGSLSPIVRGVPGLTILPRASSTAVLIGSDSGQGIALSIRPSKDGTTLSLPLQTVADKCVWAPGAGLMAYCAVPQTSTGTYFLDNWYRGDVHTADSWFKVEGGAGTAESFFTIDADSAIDVERPTMDDTGIYIEFMNARDKSLWLLRITE